MIRSKRTRRRSTVPAVLLLGITLAAAQAPPAGRRLGLDEAVMMALQKTEGIIIEREGLNAARAAEEGAHGAYDPLLQVNGSWERLTDPVNSAFSGAPAGEPAPTIESTGTNAAVSQYLPTGGTVTASLSATRSATDGSFSLLSPAYLTQAGLEFRQPLLRDRATDPARSAIRIAAVDRSRAEASLQREVSNTIALVETAYWNSVAALSEVGVREEAVRLASEQLDDTRDRIEEGAAPETELAQPRAELERRRGELLAARESSARADNALKLLILGDDDTADWSEKFVATDEPAVPIEAVDVSSAMQRALTTRPELREAEAARERRRLETALAHDATRPALDAVASYDRYGLAGSANPDASSIPGLPTLIPDGMEGGWRRSFAQLDESRFDDTRVALEFSFPIGNRAARAGEAVALSGERVAEADLVRERKTIRAEVLDAAAALETAGQRIEAARAAREAAEVQLSAEHDRYLAGLSTNFLVLTRQNDLSSARLDEISALTDYRKARAEMARATGSLLEERRIEIDAAATKEDSHG